MKIKYIILVGVFLLAACRARENPTALAKNRTWAQLTAIRGELGLAELEAQKTNASYEVREILNLVAQAGRLEMLRCEIRKREWVALCPDSGKWRNGDAHSEEIWLYCPVPFNDE